MQDLLAIVEKLVSFNTVSKNCSVSDDGTGYRLFNEYVCEYFKKAGFKFTPHGTGNKINLEFTKGPGQNRPALALSGHSDTVPYDLKKWKQDVFKIKKSDKGLEALGIADMKTFLAMAMIAATSIPDEDFTEDLAIYFTHSEEIGCKGVKILLKEENFTPASRIIVGEPTSMQPMCFQKGYIYFEIAIKRDNDNGCSHSSDPRTLVNAITSALPEVIYKLEEFGSNLKKFRNNSYQPTNYATLNIGVITMPADAAKNIIPGEVKLECDIRFMHGQNNENIFELLRSILDRTASDINRNRNSREKISINLKLKSSPTQPLVTPVDCDLALMAKQIFNQSIGGVSYSSEATIFSHNANVDTIILGPGDIKNAHCPRESISEDFFNPIHIENYIKLIRHFCCRR